MKPDILLDVDGVSADFVGSVLRYSNLLTGHEHTPDHVTEWAMERALGWTEGQEKLLREQVIGGEGFCASIELYDGARHGIEQIREFANVYAVTAPFNSKYWLREREQWLVNKLGFNRNEVVFASSKQLVRGDALVDDKTSTLIDWKKSNRGSAILFSQPWNLHDPFPVGLRVYHWEGLVHTLRTMFTPTEPQPEQVVGAW